MCESPSPSPPLPPPAGGGGGGGADPAELVAAKQEVEKLSRDLAESKASVAALSAATGDGADAAAASAALHARLQAAVDEHKTRADAHDADVARLNSAVETHEKEKAELAADAKSHKADAKKAKKEAEDAVKKMQEATAAKEEELVTAMEAEVEKVLAETKAEHEKEKKASNKKLKKLKEQSSNVTKALGPVKKSAGALKAATDALRSETKSVLATVPDVTKEVGDAIIARVQAQIQSVEDLQRNYTRELKERKRLFNLVQELKGNIRVFCRCRPPSGRELDETQANSEGGVCVTMEGAEGSVRVVNDRGKEKDWEFNKSFDFKSTQEGVYQEVSPVVTSVLDGYNVCIFAYGQTGSGKTYTMMGPPDNRGVNTRTLEELFVKSGERSAEVEDKIQVSILEIYCEQIRDLLAENVGAQRLEIRQGDKGNYVPNLTWVPVSGRLP